MQKKVINVNIFRSKIDFDKNNTYFEDVNLYLDLIIGHKLYNLLSS